MCKRVCVCVCVCVCVHLYEREREGERNRERSEKQMCDQSESSASMQPRCKGRAGEASCEEPQHSSCEDPLTHTHTHTHTHAHTHAHSHTGPTHPHIHRLPAHTFAAEKIFLYTYLQKLKQITKIKGAKIEMKQKIALSLISNKMWNEIISTVFQ